MQQMECNMAVSECVSRARTPQTGDSCEGTSLQTLLRVKELYIDYSVGGNDE